MLNFEPARGEIAARPEESAMHRGETERRPSVELVAHTQPNPALTPEAVADTSDLSAIHEGNGTFAENLVEYAGRVCYRSTHRMGTSPNFISARIREAHEDIIEHIVATLRVWPSKSNGYDPLRWRLLNRHCEITEEITESDDGSWLVSGNLRVWLQFFRDGILLEAVPILHRIAPKVFEEFRSTNGQVTGDKIETADSSSTQSSIFNLQSLAPASDGPMRVTLLGYTQPQLADADAALHHGQAVFFFEGISRTCTHQLVRHRLASFSQESQRYVDLSKGGWAAVVPDAVAANEEAVAKLNDFWQSAEETYAELRKLGIRKEDARFILPNAAETRIVTSMNFAAWSHFLWLRAIDKAAQWEIRRMGQRALEMLHAVAPDVFAEHWEVYQRDFAPNIEPNR